MVLKFTWRKKTYRSNNIFEWLDHEFASINWLDLFLKALISNHVFSSSDHCPIYLYLLLNKKTLKLTPFKFEKMWCQKNDFDTLTKKTSTMFQGSYMYCLVQKYKITLKKC